MINISKLKQKQREAAQKRGGKQLTFAELRLHKDMSELSLPMSTSITFPNGKDELTTFEISIQPNEGYYTEGTFVFTVSVSPLYPYDPPKVKCKTKVYHPNIDLEGNVCLNILRDDWKPVLTIQSVIYGLDHLFTNPNHEDPLNSEAAAVLRYNPQLFQRNIQTAMAGGYVGNTRFPGCIPYDDISMP
eukprot:Gb_16782 [translate_table: standard]